MLCQWKRDIHEAIGSRRVAKRLYQGSQRRIGLQRELVAQQGGVDRGMSQRAGAVAQFDQRVHQLLSTTTGAIRLLCDIEDQKLPRVIRDRAIAIGTTDPHEQVRDLFERFVPEEQRAKRLGTNIDAAALLVMKGDGARGRQVFFESNGGLCKQCHQINGVGEVFGPELTHIASKYNKGQILENILQPSKTIDPQFVTYLVKTSDNEDPVGIIVRQDDREVVVRQAANKEVTIARKNIRRMTAQSVSAMPEFLLSGLTAEQAADLLEFLSSLK